MARYVDLLDALHLKRTVYGPLAPGVEERFVAAMADCRQLMTPAEKAQVDEIVAEGGVK